MNDALASLFLLRTIRTPFHAKSKNFSDVLESLKPAVQQSASLVFDNHSNGLLHGRLEL